MQGGAAESYVPPKRLGRLIAIIVALLIVSNLTTGLAVYYLAPGPTGGAELTVIGPWSGSEMQAFLPILDAFTNKTGIKTLYTQARQEDLKTILPVQFSARRTPGDVIFMVNSFIKQAATAGNALDVTGLIDASQFATAALDPVTVSGKVYGGVYTGKLKPGFWFKPSFFAAHGLSKPTNFTEFQSLLQSIKNVAGITAPIVSGDGKGWPLSDVTEHFIATYGGASMHRNLTSGSVSWTSTPVRDVFATRLVPLLQAGDFTEPLEWDSTALQAWISNQSALYFMGSWFTGMTGVHPNDLDVFPLPAVSGTTAGLVLAADYFFIPKYTAKADAAKALLKFLASTEGQTLQVRKGGHLATVLGIGLSEYPAIDQKVVQYLQAQLALGKQILPDLDDTKGEPFQSNFWSQLKGLWTSLDPAGDLDTILAAIQSEA